MADRVNYFLLGLLFLIVAGVIAYDRWNPGAGEEEPDADGQQADATIVVKRGNEAAQPPGEMRISPEAISLPPMGGERQAVPPVSGTRPVIDLDPLRSSPSPRDGPPARVAPRPVVPEPTPAPSPRTGSERFHVVRSGESLERISMTYYGTIRGVEKIARANGISNRNRIFANQKLVIPALSETVRRAPAPYRPAGSRRSAGSNRSVAIPSSYTVRSSSGDLYDICRRFYGSSGLPARVDQVMELNGLWSSKVAVGSILQLPTR